MRHDRARVNSLARTRAFNARDARAARGVNLSVTHGRVVSRTHGIAYICNYSTRTAARVFAGARVSACLRNDDSRATSFKSGSYKNNDFHVVLHPAPCLY